MVFARVQCSGSGGTTGGMGWAASSLCPAWLFAGAALAPGAFTLGLCKLLLSVEGVFAYIVCVVVYVIALRTKSL
jgi:hypothetical protein